MVCKWLQRELYSNLHVITKHTPADCYPSQTTEPLMNLTPERISLAMIDVRAYLYYSPNTNVSIYVFNLCHCDPNFSPRRKIFFSCQYS